MKKKAITGVLKIENKLEYDYEANKYVLKGEIRSDSSFGCFSREIRINLEEREVKISPVLFKLFCGIKTSYLKKGDVYDNLLTFAAHRGIKLNQKNIERAKAAIDSSNEEEDLILAIEQGMKLEASLERELSKFFAIADVKLGISSEVKVKIKDSSIVAIGSLTDDTWMILPECEIAQVEEETGWLRKFMSHIACL